MTIDEKKIASMMKNLDCTREEAIETIKADMAIDRMTDKEVKASYTAEERQAIKEAIKTGKKKTVYKFDRKPKEKDAAKVDFTKQLMELCATIPGVSDLVEKNPGKEITFKVGDRDYSLSLTLHRPPKTK